MGNKIIDALYRVFADAIEEDFWHEESDLVDAYYDVMKDQLDCDGIGSWMDKDGTMRITIGGFEFKVRISEE